MAYRLHIKNKTTDTRALVQLKKLQDLGFGEHVTKVNLVDVYTIDKEFSEENRKKINRMLANPVMQKGSFDSLGPDNFSHAIEIGYLPGVTDNVAHTAKESIEDLLKTAFLAEENVYTSQIIFLKGALEEENITNISENLYNPLIQRIHIKKYDDYVAQKGMDAIVPKVTLTSKPSVDSVSLNISDEDLVELGTRGIVNEDGSRRGPLSLSLDYLKAIQAYYKEKDKNPTDIELEMLAQTWSEHCKHTIFASSLDEVTEGIYKRYIKGATQKIRQEKGDKDICRSVFKDNSGAIEFDHKWLVTDKVETHNSPSALDPYGGSITGIVGVNRDTIGFGMGAKPIINKYGFCFGLPHDTKSLYRSEDKKEKLLSPKRIMEGVIEGVKDGGNQSGIPTPQGFSYFEERYKGKPLVFVGTVGLIPKKIPTGSGWEKRARSGDLIVMVGGRVGKDGIHGATFSSEALTQGSPVSAVQIGDPITQKKMSDVIVKEARDKGLYHSITDNGAGGLSSSVGEMARESGGCEVWLDKVPLKYPGLAPWEIWISESQERMTVSVIEEKKDEFFALMKRRGVEATVIGKFTETGKCVVLFNEKTIVDLELDFVHDGLPEKIQASHYQKPDYPEPDFPCPEDATETLLGMLARYSLCDQSFIARQYDHEVQASSVLKPLQGRGAVFANTTVSKPILTSQKGVLLSQALNPTYSDYDTYHMAACAIDTAIRNIIAAGGTLNHLALLDNFCWCDSTNPQRLAELKEAAKACYDYAIIFGTPFISGKDSMFNDFHGYDEQGHSVKISIPPTLLVSSIGVMDDVAKVVSLDTKMPGDLVYVLGETRAELSGSEYYSYLKDKTGQRLMGRSVPQVNAKQAKSLYEVFAEVTQSSLIASSQSVSLGGLAIALAKKSIGGTLGMQIDLTTLKTERGINRNDFVLFSETQSRFVVTVAARKRKQFEDLFQEHSLSCIGEVVADDRFEVKGINGNRIVKTTVSQLTEAYRGTFKDY
jgi:phosphoribosylformylglycinamidine synthase subunit PurSL